MDDEYEPEPFDDLDEDWDDIDEDYIPTRDSGFLDPGVYY